jgi:hypothetical protein
MQSAFGINLFLFLNISSNEKVLEDRKRLDARFTLVCLPCFTAGLALSSS